MARDKSKNITTSATLKESSLLAENSFVIIGGLMLLGLAFIVLFSVNEGRNWGNILAVVSLVMLASFAVGAILGFIFGIPRTLQGDGESMLKKQGDSDDSKAKSDNGASVRSNTNLEQLSDWLTKIIVGVGLVEFKEIASSIATLSERLSNGIMDPRFGFTIISTTVIFYLLMGFLVCYLWTRIYFEKILKSQIDNTRLNKLEQAKNIQEEIADLKESFQIEKARSVVEKIINKTGDKKEKTNYFQEIVLIAFDKRDYLNINTLVNEFDSKIDISPKTWADVAIANMNLFDSTHNEEYYKKSYYACERSILLLKDYGVPQMIKIYLELIKFKVARNNDQLEIMEDVRRAIQAIVKDIAARGLVTSYEAYNYFNVNPNWDDYNHVFQTEFADEFDSLHELYKKYTEQQSKK